MVRTLFHLCEPPLKESVQGIEFMVILLSFCKTFSVKKEQLWVRKVNMWAGWAAQLETQKQDWTGKKG